MAGVAIVRWALMQSCIPCRQRWDGWASSTDDFLGTARSAAARLPPGRRLLCDGVSGSESDAAIFSLFRQARGVCPCQPKHRPRCTLNRVETPGATIHPPPPSLPRSERRSPKVRGIGLARHHFRELIQPEPVPGHERLELLLQRLPLLGKRRHHLLDRRHPTAAAPTAAAARRRPGGSLGRASSPRRRRKIEFRAPAQYRKDAAAAL